MSKNKLKEITEKVNEILKGGEPENIQEITTPDKRTLYGYKPQSIIDALNSVYPNWTFKFSIISTEKPEDKKAYHSVVQVWIEIEGIERSHIGQSTNMNKGDSIKGAITDGIAKTLSLFSIGNRAFLGELKAVKTGSGQKQQPQSKQKSQSQTSKRKSANTISEAQVKRLYAIMKQKGYSKADVEKLIKDVGWSGLGDIPKDRYDAIVDIIETGDGNHVKDAVRIKVHYLNRHVDTLQFIDWAGEDDLALLLTDEEVLKDTLQTFLDEASLDDV